MAKNTTQVPLPYPAAEVAASRAAPLAPGVFMVRKDKHVLGLHVHPGGVAYLLASTVSTPLLKARWSLIPGICSCP